MTNEVSTPQTFEQRMKDRIRESIGDLITDEELQRMVERGVEEVFFKTGTKVINPGSYNSRTEETPSLIHQMVKELLEPTVRAAVVEYVNSHPDEVAAVIEKIVSEGVGEAVVKAVSSIFSGSMTNLQMNIMNQLQSGYR